MKGEYNIFCIEMYIMEEADRRFLRINRVLLVEKILNPGKIAILLKQNNIFTEFAVQIVCAQPTQIQGAHKLLSIIPSRGPEAFKKFMSVLRDQYPILMQELEISRHLIMVSGYLTS